MISVYLGLFWAFVGCIWTGYLGLGFWLIVHMIPVKLGWSFRMYIFSLQARSRRKESNVKSNEHQQKYVCTAVSCSRPTTSVRALPYVKMSFMREKELRVRRLN